MIKRTQKCLGPLMRRVVMRNLSNPKFMTVNYFTELFNYDNKMNREVLELLRGLPSVDEKAKSICVHILAAKQVWLSRLCDEDSSDITIWPTFSFNACETLIKENKEGYQAYFKKKSEVDLKTTIRYKNSKGIEYENSVQDTLMHVLIHSGYHRGQISIIVRESGGKPINTDYIMRIRKQSDSV